MISARPSLAARLALAMIAASASSSLTPFVFCAKAWAREAAKRFDIPAQPLASALIDFARQAQVELFMPEAPLSGAMGREVRGEFDPGSALDRLLAGTGMEGRIENGVIRLRPVQDAAAQGAPAARAPAHGERMPATLSPDIVVVGTSIRGVYPASSPISVYSADEIERTGARNTEQFSMALTQNLATRTQYGPGSAQAVNREGVNGMDLRGLGVGASLVLLDGRRLPLASEGQTPDLSFIPLNAIGRIEVLTDGASAIYGSDAIGGVVNFVLKDHVDGSEARIDYGGVARGDMHAQSLAYSTGHDGPSGDIFFAGEAYQASALERQDRGYAAASGRGDLSPADERYNFASRMTARPLDRLTIDAEALAGWRETKTQYEFPEEFLFVSSSTAARNGFLNLGLDYRINNRISFSLTASHSENDNDVSGYQEVPGQLLALNNDTSFQASDVAAKIDGRLWRLGGGPVRFSAGLGWRQERYWSALTDAHLSRRTDYFYGEVLAPFVDESLHLPWMRRLELSLAARSTEYEDEGKPRFVPDFGEHVSPKIGLLWSPAEGLNLRTSLSQSFRAPSLKELDPSGSVGQLLELPLKGQMVPVLAVFGPQALDPETAQTFTLGADYTPPHDPGFRIRATYFNITYDDRVAVPDSTGGLAPFSNPDAYPDILYATNSAPRIEAILRQTLTLQNLLGVDLSDPAAAAAALAALPNFTIYDNRLRNLAHVSLDGFDVDVAYDFDNRWGAINVGGSFTYISSYREQVTPHAPTLSAVDTVLRPVDLRGRAYVNLRRGGLNAMLTVNYVDDYRNPYGLTSQSVASWTTFDARLAYALNGDEGGHGIELSLAIQNVMDEDPPFVATSGPQGSALRAPVGFDPANANPLGRFVTLQVTRRW